MPFDHTVDACNGKNDYNVGHECAFNTPGGVKEGSESSFPFMDLVFILTFPRIGLQRVRKMHVTTWFAFLTEFLEVKIRYLYESLTTRRLIKYEHV